MIVSCQFYFTIQANVDNQACKRKAKNPHAQKDGVQKDDEIRMASMKCTPASSIKMMYRILKIVYYLPETECNGLKILNAINNYNSNLHLFSHCCLMESVLSFICYIPRPLCPFKQQYILHIHILFHNFLWFWTVIDQTS